MLRRVQQCADAPLSAAACCCTVPATSKPPNHQKQHNATRGSFITCFVTTFATVIAITKDLPDIEGDRANNITTFATRLGVKNVSLLGELE